VKCPATKPLHSSTRKRVFLDAHATLPAGDNF
jgi:hypothetical protein